MTDGVGANGADGGNGITQRSRETEVEQRTVFSVCVSVAPFLCVIPLPPCSPFTHARELEQCRRERSVIEIAAARRNQRIHEGVPHVYGIERPQPTRAEPRPKSSRNPGFSGLAVQIGNAPGEIARPPRLSGDRYP